jgi:hypothetical protein
MAVLVRGDRGDGYELRPVRHRERGGRGRCGFVSPTNQYSGNMWYYGVWWEGKIGNKIK